MKAFLILAICLAAAVPVLAQAQPTLSQLDVSLWPEFDRPGVLVIYRGQFSGDAALPLSVEFRIPAAAGSPSAVAFLDEQDQALQQAYTTRADGDWLVVAFTLSTSRGFQLEYYVPLATGEESGAVRRDFSFTYEADYAIAVLNLDVQEPVGAEGFVLEPAASAAPGPDGLTYHRATVGPLARGDTASWTLSYRKAGTGLTVDAFRPGDSTATPVTEPAAREPAVPGGLVAAGGLLAMLAVGGGAYWLGSRSRPAAAPAARPAAKKGGAPRSPAQEAGFCHQCGTRLRRDADFCQQCGAAVRRS